MNILIITDSYPPEIRSVSLMMRELAETLVGKGHDVTVAASRPRYYLSREAGQSVFDEFSIENNVNVIRVKTPPYNKINYLARGLAQLTLPHIFFDSIKKYVKKKIDVVIVYSPPLTMAILGEKIKNLHGARYLLNLQDIFPQNAVDLGILKNKTIIRFFESIEKRVYRSADHITIHTEGGRDFLVGKKGIPARKIDIVSNWIDPETFNNAKATGAFRKKYGLEGRFIFLFAGIMGPSQGIDFLIDVAGKVARIPDICFLLVGDGKERGRLQNIVERRGLKNIIFEQFVPHEEYPFLVKEADVGLICINIKNKTTVMPGKLLGFMASSLPVVAFMNREDDCCRIIRKSGCGYATLADDPDKASELVKKIFSEKDRLADYGRKGCEYASSNFSKDLCIRKIERLIGLASADIAKP